MSGYQLILYAGAQHSKANAEKIRAWRLESMDGPDRVLREIVADYVKRGFLTKADAEELLRG